MLCVVTRSGTLQRPEPQSGYPRSHAPRGNAVPDALRPVYGVARLTAFPRRAWERWVYASGSYYRPYPY